MEKFCGTMYCPPNLLKVPAIRHGRTYEAAAIKKFTEISGNEVMKSGLCIHPHYPFLGASPDGFVGKDAVVECKCPYKGRKMKIAASKEFDFLEEVDGQIRLKRNHNYYFQMLGQMKLSKRNRGFFVVYTFVDLFYEEINMDEGFFMASLLPKLQYFYNKHYCPYVASVLKK